MDYHFKIISNENLENIVPLIFKLNEAKISEELLKSRFEEIKSQYYKCAVILKNDIIIGVCGMWFCTRHYSGRSVELDHVYIEPEFRGNGLGKQFMAWGHDYVKQQGCQSIELNTYVSNHPSHKFYFNEGFEILGYHFLKRI